MMLFRALIVIALAGCMPPKLPVNLLPSPGLYDLTTDLIEAVNAEAGRPVVRIADGTSSIVWVYEHDTGGADYCGEFNYTAGEIQINTACDAQYRACALAHEVGHALGLQHSSDAGSVMFRAVQYMTLPQAAASLVAELRAQKVLP